MSSAANLLKRFGPNKDQLIYVGPDLNPYSLQRNVPSDVPRSRFLGDTGVPLPEFQRDIYKSGGLAKSFKFLPLKLNSYPEISVHFLFKS